MGVCGLEYCVYTEKCKRPRSSISRDKQHSEQSPIVVDMVKRGGDTIGETVAI